MATGITVTVPAGVAGDVVAACGQVLGSLPSDPTGWRRLVRALAAWDAEGAREVARTLIIQAVPWPGDPHPQRAEYDLTPPWAIFATPGDVAVTVAVRDEPGEWVDRAAEVLVEFRRDSQCAARGVLDALLGAVNEGSPNVTLLVQGSLDIAKITGESGETLTIVLDNPEPCVWRIQVRRHDGEMYDPGIGEQESFDAACDAITAAWSAPAWQLSWIGEWT